MFWATDFWKSGFWADDFWVGLNQSAASSTTGGGARYSRTRRTPYVTEGRTRGPSDTLYRQMFPKAVASTATEPTNDAVPVALLLAFMAIDE